MKNTKNYISAIEDCFSFLSKSLKTKNFISDSDVFAKFHEGKEKYFSFVREHTIEKIKHNSLMPKEASLDEKNAQIRNIGLTDYRIEHSDVDGFNLGIAAELINANLEFLNMRKDVLLSQKLEMIIRIFFSAMSREKENQIRNKYKIKCF